MLLKRANSKKPSFVLGQWTHLSISDVVWVLFQIISEQLTLPWPQPVVLLPRQRLEREQFSSSCAAQLLRTGTRQRGAWLRRSRREPASLVSCSSTKWTFTVGFRDMVDQTHKYLVVLPIVQDSGASSCSAANARMLHKASHTVQLLPQWCCVSNHPKLSVLPPLFNFYSSICRTVWGVTAPADSSWTLDLTLSHKLGSGLFPVCLTHVGPAGKPSCRRRAQGPKRRSTHSGHVESLPASCLLVSQWPLDSGGTRFASNEVNRKAEKKREWSVMMGGA